LVNVKLRRVPSSPLLFSLCHIKVSIGHGQYLEKVWIYNIFDICDNWKA